MTDYSSVKPKGCTCLAENQGFLSGRAIPKALRKQLMDVTATLSQWEGRMDFGNAVEEV